MESWSVAHKNLQIFCADFWSTAEDCTVILNEVGVTSIRIRMNEPSIARWYSILIELMRMNDGSMGRLVTVLISKYPQNDALRSVCAPWIPDRPATLQQGLPPPVMPAPVIPEKVAPPLEIPVGAVLVKEFTTEAESKPKPKLPPVPVVAPSDFADEAGLVVPRIDTLWEAMIDTNRRLTEMEKWRASLFAVQPPAVKRDE